MAVDVMQAPLNAQIKTVQTDLNEKDQDGSGATGEYGGRGQQC